MGKLGFALHASADANSLGKSRHLPVHSGGNMLGTCQCVGEQSNTPAGV